MFWMDSWEWIEKEDSWTAEILKLILPKEGGGRQRRKQVPCKPSYREERKLREQRRLEEEMGVPASGKVIQRGWAAIFGKDEGYFLDTRGTKREGLQDGEGDRWQLGSSPMLQLAMQQPVYPYGQGEASWNQLILEDILLNVIENSLSNSQLLVSKNKLFKWWWSSHLFS